DPQPVRDRWLGLPDERRLQPHAHHRGARLARRRPPGSLVRLTPVASRFVEAHHPFMYYGGAMFDPNPRVPRRVSLGGLATSIGILIGGLTLLGGVLLPWRVREMVGPSGNPPNGIAAAGALGVVLAILGAALV